MPALQHISLFKFRNVQKFSKWLLAFVSVFAMPEHLFAQTNIDKADTAWVLVSTALVILMTPAGLALFYGGLTRSKNMLNTIGMSYVAFCTATIVWMIAGYTLAFTQGTSIIGSLDKFMLYNIPINAVKGTIPEMLFVAFQGAFAAIAVAIVSGSVIERMKFSSWILFVVLWTLLVYSPLAHWIWGGGFLSNSGELDFAGGTVIHINAGIAGLVLALLLGKRKDFKPGAELQPASIKLTVLGSALLWFGWFGFNAGSELAVDFITVNAFMVTNLAACAGGLVWLLVEWNDKKKPTLIGSASGVISGLVAITPAAGYVSPIDALWIGLLAGLVGYIGVVKLKAVLEYDDTLDAFGIHGLVGIFGSIAAGVWANPVVNNATGLIYGNPLQLIVQLKAVVVTILYSATVTFLVYKLVSFITAGARVDEEIESEGLDKSFHGEKGFDLA